MVYRKITTKNSSPLDTLNRLTFVPAKYAKERPTYRHIESNTVVLLDGDSERADQVCVRLSVTLMPEMSWHGLGKLPVRTLIVGSSICSCCLTCVVHHTNRVGTGCACRRSLTGKRWAVNIRAVMWLIRYHHIAPKHEVKMNCSPERICAFNGERSEGLDQG